MPEIDKKCRGCEEFHEDTDRVSVNYCGPKGPLTGDNIKKFPKECGELYKPKDNV